MAAEDRAQDASVALRALADALWEDPTEFGFFQAVRLLERLNPGRAPVGRFVDPADEVVRFSVPPVIRFPPSEIASLEQEEDGRARMAVTFMGLTGPTGVLPYEYTLLVAQRARARDGALAAFLNLFHHRILSLFHRAWEKHRFTIAYEQADRGQLTRHLLDLIGMGMDAARARAPLVEDALVFYAGLLGLRPRGATALEQLIADFFGVPAQVEQFVGAWYPLPRRDQCALGEDDGISNRLGVGSVIGDEIWDQQSRVRIRLGPLARSQYESFLPGGDAFEELRRLTRFFSRDELEFEVQLVLARDDVPGVVLGPEDDGAQPLGWMTWIRTVPLTRDADETIFAL